MKAIIQIGKTEKEVTELIRDLGVDRAHWYYYETDEGLREEVEDLLPFYEGIVIVVEKG